MEMLEVGSFPAKLGMVVCLPFKNCRKFKFKSMSFIAFLVGKCMRVNVGGNF